MPNLLLFINGSSKVARLDNLHNNRLPGYINNATVTMTLTDQTTGVAIVGETWPVTLSYVTGSNGRYEVTLSYALAVTEGQRLLASCLAVHGLLRRPWVSDVLVVRGE